MKKIIFLILIIMVLICTLMIGIGSVSLVKSYDVQKITDLEGIDHNFVFIVLNKNIAINLGFDSPDIFGLRIKSFNLQFVVFVPGPIMDPIFIA